MFGIEVAIRALRKKDQPFAPRAKWNVTICLAIVGMLSLVNFLVANFDRAPNFCLTSLFWFVAHWATGCFALLVGITSCLIISLVIIFIKLTRSIKIEVEARVAASRMVYYLALGIISNVSISQIWFGSVAQAHTHRPFSFPFSFRLPLWIKGAVVKHCNYPWSPQS